MKTYNTTNETKVLNNSLSIIEEYFKRVGKENGLKVIRDNGITLWRVPNDTGFLFGNKVILTDFFKGCTYINSENTYPVNETLNVGGYILGILPKEVTGIEKQLHKKDVKPILYRMFNSETKSKEDKQENIITLKGDMKISELPKLIYANTYYQLLHDEVEAFLENGEQKDKPHEERVELAILDALDVWENHGDVMLSEFVKFWDDRYDTTNTTVYKGTEFSFAKVLTEGQEINLDAFKKRKTVRTSKVLDKIRKDFK